jgi:hypothetical protein
MAYHELCSRNTFGKALLDESVSKDDFGEFNRKVVFVAGAILLDRRSNTNGGNRYILPDEFLRETGGWFQTKQLAILQERQTVYTSTMGASHLGRNPSE